MNKKLLLLLGLCVGALCLLGLVMLYSTAFTAKDQDRVHAQLIYLADGLVMAPLLVRLDYRWLQRRAVLYVLGGICLLLLVAVYIPGVGVQVNGSNRWVRGLGQPSELAKPVVILLLSAYLCRLNQWKAVMWKPGFLWPLLLGAVPAGLIFCEQDWGTATLLLLLTLTLLLISGARWQHLALTIIGALPVAAMLVAHNAVRLERIMVFLDPEAARHGAGRQVWQSLLAIGSGGMRGHFLDGSLHKFGYVPEQQTDFIFARIGEEMGLWGTSLVVLLFLGIFLVGLHTMKHARDRFGQFIAAGCTTVMALQACINMAVATSLVPNKGLPLPFMSYGGSGLLAMFVCAGLLGSVAWRAREMKPATETPAQNQAGGVQLNLSFKG